MSGDTVLNPEFLVRTEADLRARFPATHDIAIKKCLDHVDDHARAFIERSPFVCIGTQSANGAADVSPRGDPRGFVKVLDSRTLLIPDRPGNNRLDTLSNILTNPKVGLLFLVPGFDDTMRVNGRAELTRDPALLSSMAVNERIPGIAIAVHVDEVFIHCAKALRRSRLWDAGQFQNRRDVPSLMKIILDQTTGAPSDPEEQKRLDEGLEEKYRQSMY
ncbi:pyridoxamine 5'-phosphate oxidase family protein [Histidinibacterium lentulum]|uniref:Pyridoxamine 5'-phosphate oxidase family protein n=1 Tax=Histidinibacterium lentulum TaxID=2480588 RepID=A0A3N2R593_9RHOB|nr:pyridoxamine 5'-phosphate oxidase family protein [Histidinibacterium lentulum]ROU02558.1 pyridoxamine 5'-phosphate oxidase family protein [Histidinibacterium lentulum]